MSDPTADQQAVAACEHRIVAAAADIAELLAFDVSDYPERELQRRFMVDPSRADALADADLKRLRIEAQELGAELRTAVTETLKDAELWLRLADGDDEVPQGKELRDVEPIWSALGFVDRRLEALAHRYNLADERDPPGYVPPRRFVQRKYLPTLVEAYLRDVHTLRNLRSAAASKREEITRQSLSARWVAADPGKK